MNKIERSGVDLRISRAKKVNQPSKVVFTLGISSCLLKSLLQFSPTTFVIPLKHHFNTVL